MEESSQHKHLKKASYPIPQPLSYVLHGACCRNSTEINVQLDSVEIALEQLIANAIQALDAMYFSTPSSIRSRTSFSHRLCLRIETDPSNQTISITDLGIGMTRADVINSLGCGGGGGRELSPRALYAARHLRELWKNGSGSEMDEEEGWAMEEEEEEEDVSPKTESTLVPCTNADIGGFYSALCSLAVGANVGTKSKFDDYYEFEIGTTASSLYFEKEEEDHHHPYSHFFVTRPLDEGVLPSLSIGYGSLTDVRGESGTRVTFYLNKRAVDAGLLDEEKVLKPLITQILHRTTTSQYHVVFSSDDSTTVQNIIHASRIEDDDKPESTEDAVEDVDIHSIPEQHHAQNGFGSHASVKERSKYIPLRLSLGERKMLRLVEAAMACSDYTSFVDHSGFKSKAFRTHAQLRGITAILRGMVTACDYAAGQKILEEGNYAEYESFFRQMFEIARRHKIMNPEKMRENYGKLIFVLQDAVSPSVQPHLGFSCKAPIQTVYKFLEEHNGIPVLEDPLIEIATQEVLAEKKTRGKITAEIKRKEKAVESIKYKYRSSNLSSEDIHLCLYSICDNNSFLNSNRVPIDKIILYLQKFFAPESIQPGYSLSIVSGKDGARLSHSHERQYYFALQSLTLWRDIIDDMFRLWHMAEEDLLSASVTYALTDTGQGYQRVQQSPRTYKAMQQILARVQGKVKQWVGSSVIHLGDHNVPNALSFIDKYTQVPRILGPIVVCLENLERICEEDDGISSYITSSFGSLETLTKDILYDFFKSAFDGSGADNFYDAGSCIDGRLTSAWNWCSQLPNKRYYGVFKLTGFIGFDGEFK